MIETAIFLGAISAQAIRKRDRATDSNLKAALQNETPSRWGATARFGVQASACRTEGALDGFGKNFSDSLFMQDPD